jgi:hypothetical protein
MWEVRKVVRAIGLCLMGLPAVIGVVLLVPVAFPGPDDEHAPGMKAARLLSVRAVELFHTRAAIAALITMGVGLAIFLASALVPDSRSRR